MTQAPPNTPVKLSKSEEFVPVTPMKRQNGFYTAAPWHNQGKTLRPIGDFRPLSLGDFSKAKVPFDPVKYTHLMGQEFLPETPNNPDGSYTGVKTMVSVPNGGASVVISNYTQGTSRDGIVFFREDRFNKLVLTPQQAKTLFSVDKTELFASLSAMEGIWEQRDSEDVD